MLCNRIIQREATLQEVCVVPLKDSFTQMLEMGTEKLGKRNIDKVRNVI